MIITNTPSNIKPVDILTSSDYLYLTCNSNNHLMVEALSSFYYQINMNAYYLLSMSYNRTKNVYTYYITRVYEDDLSGGSEEEYYDNSGG